MNISIYCFNNKCLWNALIVVTIVSIFFDDTKMLIDDLCIFPIHRLNWLNNYHRFLLHFELFPFSRFSNFFFMPCLRYDKSKQKVFRIWSMKHILELCFCFWRIMHVGHHNLMCIPTLLSGYYFIQLSY